MHCPNCNEHYDSGKFCPECGVPLVEGTPASSVSGATINLGDANAISGGIHLSDSHNVHNEDRSVHNITNTTSTVNNITQTAAQKTESELLQERKSIYLNACKRAYEDNVLEQSEVVELEGLRIKLCLDKETADGILESVRVMSERNARKSNLNPIARIKLNILTENLKKNEVKALMDQIDSLEALVRRFDHDELSRKYFLVLAALKPEKCIETKEQSRTDSYWESYWSYLAYIKQGCFAKAESVLISLDRFSGYPEDNMSVLATAGALIAGNTAEAKEYLNALTGEYTPALQRFVDSMYLLLEKDMAVENGADENSCAFYLVNFFGHKDPKTKAEVERLKNLGDSYYQEENYSEALECFRKLAEQGDNDSQSVLRMYLRVTNAREFGQKKDREKIAAYRSRKDSPDAMAKYKKLLDELKEVWDAIRGGANSLPELKAAIKRNVSVIAEINMIMAIQNNAEGVLLKAAEQGYAEAQFDLGLCYYEGTGVEKDYSKAVKWFRKLAEQGDNIERFIRIHTQYYLGLCYYFGHGVEKDYNEAAECFSKADSGACPNAMYYMGLCYYFGHGVEKDYRAAISEFVFVAQEGLNGNDNEANAYYYMGECYYYGRGVEKNYKYAVKWYREAAEHGNADAQKKLEDLHIDLS